MPSADVYWKQERNIKSSQRAFRRAGGLSVGQAHRRHPSMQHHVISTIIQLPQTDQQQSWPQLLLSPEASSTSSQCRPTQDCALGN